MTPTWPDLGPLPLPRNAYSAACWLLGRYPRLAALTARVSGVVYLNNSGVTTVDLSELALGFEDLARRRRDWDAYEASTGGVPNNENAFNAWTTGGPKAEDYAASAADLGVMSSGEQSMLRLLAMLGSHQVLFSVVDCYGFDAGATELFGDWLTAMSSVIE